MLTSGNQYLRPEYLSPLPTTLDAKKSPLALLAQTCSNIGADNPNNKPIIPILEKPKEGNNENKKDKSPVVVSDESTTCKTSFLPYESINKKEENINPDFCGKKTPNSKGSSPSVVSRGSPALSNGSCGKTSPASSEASVSNSNNVNKSESNSISSLASSSASNTNATQNTLSGLGYGASTSIALDLGRTEASKESLPHLGISAYKALNGLNPLSNCTGCISLPTHPADAHAYQSSAQSSLLKTGGFPLSPYVGYTRMKTPNGGTTIIPMCRDPYCTNCQFSMHNAQLSTCPSGCTACTHDRLSTSLPAHGVLPGLTGSAAAMAAVAAASYPHSLFARPNVCSWMIGDTECGRRFSTSEELLQHVRTHTNLSTTDAPLSLLPPSFSLASSNLNAACHMHYSSATSLSSAAGLRRTYPTTLSPVSPLSAANRYHPYKPSFSALQSAPIPQLSHPALGMYYPYSLYGQRLGPPVHP